MENGKPVDGVNCSNLCLKFFNRGGVVKQMRQSDLKKQLLSQIDKNDQLELEKVER